MKNARFYFSGLPEKYEKDLQEIVKEDIKKAYSKFDFNYFDFSNFTPDEFTNKKEEIKKSLFNFLIYNKFIVYQKLQVNANMNDRVNIIFCVEKHCYFMHSIDNSYIDSLIDESKPKENRITPQIIEFSNNFTEINAFYSKYKRSIVANEFISMTINPILLYLIKRYDYPSNYFKDQSFFNFDKLIQNETNEETNEAKIEKKLNDFFQLKNLFEIEREGGIMSYEFNNEIKEDKPSKKIYEFKSNDFIDLRDVGSSNKASIKFVLHRPTFYVFVKKEVSDLSDREIDFCSNYSHRCFTRFYGFFKKNENIQGFIYEYMSNGSLTKFIKNDLNNSFCQFTTLIRVVDGINYLHSNSLIHRDLKPDNILIDHDYKAYIADYVTIRSIEKDCVNVDSNQIKLTGDFGSSIYTSPEQVSSNYYSFETDIYSLGGIIYFIFEKKNMFYNKSMDEIRKLKENDEYPELTKCTSNIQQLYKQCLKYDPKERPN